MDEIVTSIKYTFPQIFGAQSLQKELSRRRHFKSTNVPRRNSSGKKLARKKFLELPCQTCGQKLVCQHVANEKRCAANEDRARAQLD